MEKKFEFPVNKGHVKPGLKRWYTKKELLKTTILCAQTEINHYLVESSGKDSSLPTVKILNILTGMTLNEIGEAIPSNQLEKKETEPYCSTKLGLRVGNQFGKKTRRAYGRGKKMALIYDSGKIVPNTFLSDTLRRGISNREFVRFAKLVSVEEWNGHTVLTIKIFKVRGSGMIRIGSNNVNKPGAPLQICPVRAFRDIMKPVLEKYVGPLLKGGGGSVLFKVACSGFKKFRVLLDRPVTDGATHGAESKSEINRPAEIISEPIRERGGQLALPLNS